MNVSQWTASTRKLIETLRAKKRAAERRAAAADLEAREHQEQIDLLADALKAFEGGSAPPAPKQATESASNGRPTLRRLVEEHALAHEGRVVLADIAQEIVDAGHYGDKTRAGASIQSELSRMPHVVRLERGVYRVLSVNGTPTAAPV